MKTLFQTVLSIALVATLRLQAEDPANRIVVIAHRGNHENAHENTLEAIRDAIQADADFVELDVRRTKDQQHVLSHDRSLKRMTGKDASVNDLTLEEIQKLQVIDRRRTNISPSRIPTFTEALDAIESKIGLYLDFKDGDPDWVASELRRRHNTNVVVYVGITSVPQWRRIAPELRLIVSVPEESLSPGALGSFLKNYPDVVLDGPITGYTRERVRIAQVHGVKVWPDIQNPGENKDQWSKAIELGVDGLQTDHPTELITWLKSIGRH